MTKKGVSILGIPYGEAAEQKGSELGPASIRKARVGGRDLLTQLRILGLDVEDLGDVVSPQSNLNEQRPSWPHRVAEVAELSLSSANAVQEILRNGRTPICMGGDHSVAIGTFSGVSNHFKKENRDIGLLWFDAHADINTPNSSPSGNIHGMPLAVLLGEGPRELVDLVHQGAKLNPSHFAHIGARDLDAGEREMVKKLGLEKNFFTMSDIDRRGMVACMEEALSIVSKASGGYAVTFDVDIIDPRFAPGSGTLVRGGITYREAHLAMEMVAENGLMQSFEIVEVNPLLDSQNITVELAGELILSAFGKTII